MYQTNFVTVFMGIVTIVQATSLNQTYEAKVRILGGEEARPGEFPFIILLECGDSSSAIHCGGSIIHPQWILTAAHCLGLSPCYVIAGLHKTKSTDILDILDIQVIRVKRTYPHKRYFSTAAYDIALLQLEEELEFNDKVRSIALPVPGSRPKLTEKLTVAGWGAVSAKLNLDRLDFDKEFPSALQKIDVFPLDFRSCRRKLKNSVLNHPFTHNMCATGKSLCWGDSGGPLFSQDRKLIAVVSSSYPTCSAADFPDVYVRVSAFIGWINNHVLLEPNKASSFKPHLAHLLIPLQICSLFRIPHYLLTV